MPLSAPLLDDRNFDDLYAEARERIVRYSRGQWNDFNDSDPGITLVQLFAWLTETMLFRMNQIPERSFIKFLELMNLRLDSAKSAETSLTLLPNPNAIETRPWIVPELSRFQADATGEGQPLVFETKRAIELVRRKLNAIQVFDNGIFRTVVSDLGKQGLMTPLRFHPFGQNPQVGNALYLGFEPNEADKKEYENKPIPERESHVHRNIFPERIRFRFLRPADPRRELHRVRNLSEEAVVPPGTRMQWEYRRTSGEGIWRPLDLFVDETAAFTRDGYVEIEGPPAVALTDEGRLVSKIPENRDGAHFWLRCRLETSSFPGGIAPQLQAVLPNSVDVVNLSTVERERLGTSDGSPDQFFELGSKPVDPSSLTSLQVNVSRSSDDVVGPDRRVTETWDVVEDFENSTAEDRHFTLDPEAGRIAFGNGEHGQIPTAAAEIVAASYRAGGGVAGNVDAGAIKSPVTPFAFIEGAANFRRAEGGRDAQSVDDMVRTAPAKIRSQGRTVTVDDYDSLAKAAGGVFQVRTLANHHPSYPGVAVPGAVTVVIVADSVENPSPSHELLEAVGNRLDEARLITTELHVVGPQIARLEIELSVDVDPSLVFGAVQTEIEHALENFFEPYKLEARKRLNLPMPGEGGVISVRQDEETRQRPVTGREMVSRPGMHDDGVRQVQHESEALIGRRFPFGDIEQMVTLVRGVRDVKSMKFVIDGKEIKLDQQPWHKPKSEEELIVLKSLRISRNAATTNRRGR